MQKVIVFWKVGLWSTLILVMCFLPGSAFKSVKTFEHTDKIIHTTFYLVHTFLLIGAFDKYKNLTNKQLNYSTIIISVPLSMGLFVELVQHFLINNRYWDVYDIAANALGVSLAFVFSKNQYIKKQLHALHII